MVISSAARATPRAMAATIGRVLSKVCMTPPKAFLRAASVSAISAEPSTWSRGIRHSVKESAAVSEMRRPILSSTRASCMPGLSRGTMNDLIAALPSDLSRVAHTTTASQRWPPVQ